jgi:hypothetical protein
VYVLYIFDPTHSQSLGTKLGTFSVNWVHIRVHFEVSLASNYGAIYGTP